MYGILFYFFLWLVCRGHLSVWARLVPDLEKLYSGDLRVKELLDTAKHMEGVVRNAGTHAAGVVITDKPIIEYAPLHRPTASSATQSSETPRSEKSPFWTPR